jgi:hypothetical protein
MLQWLTHKISDSVHLLDVSDSRRSASNTPLLIFVCLFASLGYSLRPIRMAAAPPIAPLVVPPTMTTKLPLAATA